MVMMLVAAALALSSAPAGTSAAHGESLGDDGAAATAALLDTLYANGEWRMCDSSACAVTNSDWGADSLTYTLALRYVLTHDASLLQPLAALEATAPTYGAPCADVTTCGSWSDVPEWDAIAAMDEYEASGDPAALTKAEAAYAFVQRSVAFALGACPAIRYQQPGGRDNQLKTLETDANAIKAALLLYRATRIPTYLSDAEKTYTAVRHFFLDPKVPLYTVYVFDDGTSCHQVSHRFFASVNGDMVWSGLALATDTGSVVFRTQALATANAVSADLGDARGIFTDLQAENDIVEPLVEAMYGVARLGYPFARGWILRNAVAALGARSVNGTFGRFWDGPPPQTTVTAWQANGGASLEIAAAALAPDLVVQPPSWADASTRPTDVSRLPSHISFRGSGIALMGTLGQECCEAGHARVFIDGRETFDQTGIWQNKSSAGISIPGTVLFAWRWPRPGRHTLTFEPGIPNGKEGGSFLRLSAFQVLRT